MSLPMRMVPLLLAVLMVPSLAWAEPSTAVQEHADALAQELDETTGVSDAAPAATNATPQPETAADPPAGAPAELATPAAEPSADDAEAEERSENAREWRRYRPRREDEGDRCERIRARHHRRPSRHEARKEEGPKAPPCAGNRAVCHRLGVGLEADAAITGLRPNSVEVIGTAGVRLSFTLARFAGVGIRQIGVVQAPLIGGDRWAVEGAPYAELFVFLRPFLQLYAEGGVALQRRVGAALPARTGVAPFATAGLRIWMGNHFTLAPTLRTYYVASNSFLMWRRALPEGAVVATLGLSSELHF